MTLTLISVASFCLVLCESLVHAKIEYPTTIEIDILYPHPDVKARDEWLPVVLAIQDAEAAYYHGFTVRWLLYPEGGNESEYIQTYNSSNFERFRYGILESDAAIVVDTESSAATVNPGRYNFTWEFFMFPCNARGRFTTIESSTVVASGSFFIDITSGDAGNVGDLDDWVDKCPEVGGQVTVARPDLWGCPILAEHGEEHYVERQLCNAMLLDADQRACIHFYYAGLTENGHEYTQDNETAACKSGFDVLPIEWRHPGFTQSTISSSSSTISSSTTTDISSSTAGSDEATPTATESTSVGGDESVSPVHLPGLTALTASMVVGFILLRFI